MGRGKTHRLTRRNAVADLGFLTVADVAEKYGVTPPTIRAWAREFGKPLPEPCPPGKRDRPASPRTQQIRLLVALCGRKETARRLGISKQYVSRVSKGVGCSEADFRVQLLASVFALGRLLLPK